MQNSYLIDPFSSTLRKNSSADYQLSDEALFYLYHYYQGESTTGISETLGSELAKCAVAELEQLGVLDEKIVTGDISWSEHILPKPEIFPSEMSLCSLLLDLAKRDPERKLLLVEDVDQPELEPLVLSATDAHVVVCRIAGAISGSGVRPGDIVALDADPSMETTLCIWACWSLGVVAAPIRNQYPANLRQRIFDLIKPKLVISEQGRISGQKIEHILLSTNNSSSHECVFEDWVERFDPSVAVFDVPASNPALILFSSGTTGLPKAFELSHRSVYRNTLDFKIYFNNKKNTINLSTLDFSAMGGLRYVATLPLISESMAVIPANSSRASSLALLVSAARHRVTDLSVLPATLRAVCSMGESRIAEINLTTLERVHCGTGVLHESTLAKAKQVLGAGIYDNYGMNEACGAFIFHPSGESSISAAGGLSLGILVKVVDEQGRSCMTEQEGKLMIYGDRMMSGYFDQSGYQKLQIGWFATEDVVVRSPDGLIRVLGRAQDYIKTVEGERLELFALESAVLRESKVKDVLVIPFSESSGREYVVLVVESADPEDQVQKFVNERILAEFGQSALPDKIAVMPELPRSAHGKPQREVLRNLLQKNNE